MKLRMTFASIVVVFLALSGTFLIFSDKPQEESFVKTDYTKLDLEQIDKLMIVAHPDDEVLWGGKELIENDYLVVCITCGSEMKRVYEFERVMTETKDKYVMLGYPDKTRGKKDNWNSVYDEIKEDIKKIYELKNWNKVVCHNTEGEYGHIHHKMTNEMTTDIVKHDSLYYFGKYYTKGELEEDDLQLPSLEEDLLKRKEEILNLYKTQDYTIHKTLGHMIPYENVISYADWMDTYEEN